MCIESAIAFGREQANHTGTIVVVDKSGVLDTVLEKLNYKLRYVVQRSPDGPLDAMNRAAVLLDPCEMGLITFCDNVYDVAERLPFSHSSHASVRDIETDYEHLDRWNSSKARWELRSKKACDRYNPAFAGWILAPKKVFENVDPAETLLEWMNRHQVEPSLRSLKCFDIGTPESYVNYIRSEWKC